MDHSDVGIPSVLDIFNQMTGLSREEIRWTFNRLHDLMILQGLPKEQAKAIVREESSQRPWEDTEKKSPDTCD